MRYKDKFESDKRNSIGSIHNLSKILLDSNGIQEKLSGFIIKGSSKAFDYIRYNQSPTVKLLMR